MVVHCYKKICRALELQQMMNHQVQKTWNSHHYPTNHQCLLNKKEYEHKIIETQTQGEQERSHVYI